MMRLKTRQECIGSLSRVSGAYQNGAREFARRKLRLSRVAEKLVGSIRKIARNTSGDRWRKTVILVAGEAGGCRFAGFPVGKPPVSNGKTVAAQVSWRLTAGKPPVPCVPQEGGLRSRRRPVEAKLL
ncbi:hypothetical protein BHM03_00058934 [Ensete ventricosum]|nr:hypothetical protein BHM03_00058934 [Ensete ventricosum]